MELGPLLPAAFQGLSLVTSAGGTIDVPALDWAALEGSGRIDELRAQGPDSMIELSQPAPWTLAEGTLRIPELGLEGDGSKLAMSLDSLRFDEEISFSSSGTGHLDLAILNPALAKQGLRVGGTADVAARVEYDGVTLSLKGEGDLRDGRFRLARPAFSVTEARARLELSGSTIALTKVEARAGSGSLRGERTLDWSDPTRPRLNLTAMAADVPLEVMEGLRAQVSGDVWLANPDDALELSGTLVVDLRALHEGVRGRSLGLRRTKSFDEGSDGREQVRGPSGSLTRHQHRAQHSYRELDRRARGPRKRFDRGNAGIPRARRRRHTRSRRQPSTSVTTAFKSFRVVSILPVLPVVPPRITVLAVTRVGSTVINIDVDGDVEDLGTRSHFAGQPRADGRRPRFPACDGPDTRERERRRPADGIDLDDVLNGQFDARRSR